MKIPIEKKVCVNIDPYEMALTIDAYLQGLKRERYRTVNFTIIKDGRKFNLILIASIVALSKKQVFNAVNEVLSNM